MAAAGTFVAVKEEEKNVASSPRALSTPQSVSASFFTLFFFCSMLSWFLCDFFSGKETWGARYTLSLSLQHVYTPLLVLIFSVISSSSKQLSPLSWSHVALVAHVLSLRSSFPFLPCFSFFSASLDAAVVASVDEAVATVVAAAFAGAAAVTVGVAASVDAVVVGVRLGAVVVVVPVAVVAAGAADQSRLSLSLTVTKVRVDQTRKPKQEEKARVLGRYSQDNPSCITALLPKACSLLTARRTCL